MEERVGGERSERIDAFRPEPFDRGLDDRHFFLAERGILAGMRIEAGDGEARLRNPEARRKIARGDPAVSTISAVVSVPGTSFSGMWIVTGIVLSSSHQSIITGITGAPVCSRAIRARYSV